MFCPRCGRDNSHEQRFCVTCGTNLETVSQALTGSKDDFFTKIDVAMDQFIARYSEHYFKNAPADVLDHKVGKSWKVLGQGVLTSCLDMLFFVLMWNFLPLRFLILLISTPVRLLAERNKYPRKATGELESRDTAELSEPAAHKWLSESVVSVTEQTTVNLGESVVPKQKARVTKKGL
jgi:hypothetical protein